MKCKPLVLTGAFVLLCAPPSRAETLTGAGVTIDSTCRELDTYLDRNAQPAFDENAQNAEAMASWLRTAGMPSVGQLDRDSSIPMIKDECRQHPEEQIRQVVTPIVIGAMEFRFGSSQ